jgi:hypothetical protein
VDFLTTIRPTLPWPIVSWSPIATVSRPCTVSLSRRTTNLDVHQWYIFNRYRCHSSQRTGQSSRKMLSRLALSALSLALHQRTAFAASPAEWRSRSIYQLLTDRFARPDGSTTATCDTAAGKYCGGTWTGIIDRLDYIQGMGFDAVWISPVTKNIEGDTAYGEAYHGYWQQDLYDVNSHYGSKDDLKALSQALHGRGMVSYDRCCFWF